jgi:hypothetical protein
VWCVAGLLAGGAARADDAADVKAVLDRAIAAHGGAGHLATSKAVTMQIKGKVYALGDGVDYTGEIAPQLPDRMRFETSPTVMGTGLKIKTVVKGDKGWVAVNDTVLEMSKEQLAEPREQLHVAAVAHLVALRDNAYKLSPLGEAKVEGKDAVGTRVGHEGPPRREPVLRQEDRPAAEDRDARQGPDGRRQRVHRRDALRRLPEGGRLPGRAQGHGQA